MPCSGLNNKQQQQQKNSLLKQHNIIYLTPTQLKNHCVVSGIWHLILNRIARGSPARGPDTRALTWRQRRGHAWSKRRTRSIDSAGSLPP